MDTMHIAISGAFKTFVQERVSQEGYSDPSEYVQALIEADQNRLARQELEAEILKGLESGDSAPMTPDDWRNIREEVRRRHERRVQSQSAE